jgi:hypothetical protein
MPARGLKPRKEVWRADAALMARGPKRAPVKMVSNLEAEEEWVAQTGAIRHCCVEWNTEYPNIEGG